MNINGKNLRKEKIELRDGLNEAERIKRSSIIREKLLKLDEIKKAENIFIYVNFRSEVETMLLIKHFMDQSKKISVPITHVQEKKMDAIQIIDLSKDLEPGYCKILEPKESLVKTQIINPEIIDVVIVPGSVFDKRGARFGYGGGYYDRFLEKIPFSVRIGLAFDLQIVEEAPVQAHDEFLDYIITEKRIIKGKR